jgi:hypothetical protein
MSVTRTEIETDRKIKPHKQQTERMQEQCELKSISPAHTLSVVVLHTVVSVKPVTQEVVHKRQAVCVVEGWKVPATQDLRTPATHAEPGGQGACPVRLVGETDSGVE